MEYSQRPPYFPDQVRGFKVKRYLLANGIVTLTGPEGNSRTIKARDPANLKKVQVRDLVDITYSEAQAVAVRPVNKK